MSVIVESPLQDAGNKNLGALKITIEATDLGICIGIQEHSDCCSDDGGGTPIFIEKYEGEVYLRVYGDINSEEPTESICLSGARISQRIHPDQEEPCHV